MEARKIIITGAATRMGAAIAKKLSGPNIEIVIHYNKSKSKAESLKKDLNKSGTKIYLVKADLTKEKERSGLGNFMKIIDQMKEFYSCEFDIGDIVRSGLVRSYIVQKYNTHLGDSD